MSRKQNEENENSTLQQPILRSIGILGTDMMERLGLKLDFEKKIWWLPEKPQIRYKIEANPKENSHMERG